jgi:hypothetical protein
LASTLSTVVLLTTPGGSRPERRLTAATLKPLLSGARSPKLTGRIGEYRAEREARLRMSS